MKKILLLVLTSYFLLHNPASAQHVHLFGNESRSAMYFNLDRLWSYNLYEESTWGGGLHFVIFTPFTFATRREYNIYANYSSGIHQWKYGMGVAYSIRRSQNDGTFYISGAHDYYTAASRSLDDASRCDLGSTSTFMTQRMMEQYAFTAGYSFKILDATLSFDGRWFKGWRLFDADSMYYRTEGSGAVREDGQEYRVRLDVPFGIIVQFQGGTIGAERRQFARLLGQFGHTVELGNMDLDLYLQGGIASVGAPYAYHFDLGGTFGGPVCFNSSLLMAFPNEFTAREYAIVNVRLHPVRPIFKLYSRLFSIGFKPTPYVGVSAMWGDLYGQDENGQAVIDGIPLQAPHRGLYEPVVGIDDVFCWGSLHWCVAAAYRVAEQGAPYYHEDPMDNISAMITAKIVL